MCFIRVISFIYTHILYICIYQTMQNYYYYYVYVYFFLSSEEHKCYYSLGLHGMYLVIAKRKCFWESLENHFWKSPKKHSSARASDFLLSQQYGALLQS